jgi:hypothetical protein
LSGEEIGEAILADLECIVQIHGIADELLELALAHLADFQRGGRLDHTSPFRKCWRWIWPLFHRIRTHF